MKNIFEVAKELGLEEGDIIPYGDNKAKIKWDKIKSLSSAKSNGKLVLVTSINPTLTGEGKTTIAVGLADYLSKIKKTALCLREPSLGPVFGQKGGATGGGFNKIVPSMDIDLHFTGDIHAMTSANNLIASIIHNAISNGELNISPKDVTFNRALDINDKSLRNIVYGLGGKNEGAIGQDSFNITAASEIMSIMTLATSYKDLKNRIDNIVFAHTIENGVDKFHKVKELGITDAVATLLKDAMLPNIVQTERGTPSIVHCGPFANVSVGTNSVLSTQIGLKLSDYAIVECGFGSDLGGEKFFNIIAKQNNLIPAKVVMVVTLKALKLHGGAKDYKKEDMKALMFGVEALKRHLSIIESFGVKPIIAINKFDTDTQVEVSTLMNVFGHNYQKAIVQPTKEDDNGFDKLAQIVDSSETYTDFTQSYNDSDSVVTKVENICKKIYGGDGVDYVKGVKTKIKKIESQYPNLKVCICKTQYSLTDKKDMLGAPKGFRITVTDVKLYGSVNIIVVFLGDMVSMPGYGKEPLAKKFRFDDDGNITIDK